MKKLTVLLAAACLVLGLSGTGMAIVFQGSEYQVVPGNLSWLDADAAAQALGTGWHLVTITSQGEQDFIADTLLQGLEGSGEFWAGGYQDPVTSDPAANWNWVTGEAFVFTAWATEFAIEPNDWPPNDEVYLALDGRTFSNNRNWTWNDGLNETVLGYVAERSVPEPSTLLLLGSGLLGLVGFGRRMKK